MKADYIHKDTKTLEDVVINSEISNMMIYNPNGSSILYTEEYVKEKDKEIERLNKECDTYMKIATKRGNIINELEKYLEEHSKIDFDSSDIILHEQLALSFVYDYLKELKGGK